MSIDNEKKMKDEESDNNQRNFVLNKINENLNILSKRVFYIRIISILAKLSIILLGTVSTILLGLSIKDESYIEWSRNIAFVLGAAITFIGSVLSTLDIDKYIVKEKLLIFKLQSLRDEYMFLNSRENGISEEDRSRIFYQYREARNIKIEYWEKIAEKQKNRDENKDTKSINS